jgi:hypothetical protein
MTGKTVLMRWILLLFLGIFLHGHVNAQDTLKPAKAKRPKPDQLDVLKLDVFQLGINEARLWYEMQTSRSTSLEFGLGYIYPNAFWFPRADRTMLGTGGGVYFAFRKYFDKKKYFSQPKLRSYFSPVLFYRYSAYNNAWLQYTTSDPNIFDCKLVSEKINQIGLVVRFGWQTYRGRFVIDFYSGMGFKYAPSLLTSHVMTPLTGLCTVNSTSQVLNTTEKFNGTNVILNVGLKLGLRRNNRDRHYKNEIQHPVEEANPEEPPKF